MSINLTLIGQMLSFAVFVWFCHKFVWSALINAMEERKAKIADGLNAADRAEKDLELAQEEATKKLKEAKAQAAEIIESANKRAVQIIEEAKNEASQEGERQLAKAMAEIEQEANSAKEELRAKVAELAVVGAEKILKESVDVKAHEKLLDQLASEL